MFALIVFGDSLGFANNIVFPVCEAVVNGILFFISVSVNSNLMYRNCIAFCLLILHPAILLFVD